MNIRERRRSGYARTPKGVWTEPDGTPVTDEVVLARLAALAVPPAWQDVWAARGANARVQAIGVDARGRTQYRYSAGALERAAADKYAALIDFAEGLPELREQISLDLLGEPDRPLSLKGPVAPSKLTPTLMTATAVRLIDLGLFRVGHPRYLRDNQTHGLTTLLPEQVKVRGARLTFDYIGKEHVHRHVVVEDAQAARVIRALQRAGGELLFETEDWTLRSAAINAYVNEYGGEGSTAKMFRTWGGTVAVAAVAAGAVYEEGPARKRRELVGYDAASAILGNTPTVVRNSYVHPRAFEVGESDAVRTALTGVGAEDLPSVMRDAAFQLAVHAALAAQ